MRRSGSRPRRRFRPPTKRACPAWWRRTFAIFAPVGTPAAIVARLDAATQKVMADEDFQKQLLKLGFEPVRGVGGEKATEVLRDELVRWTPILKAGGVKAE